MITLASTAGVSALRSNFRIAHCKTAALPASHGQGAACWDGSRTPRGRLVAKQRMLVVRASQDKAEDKQGASERLKEVQKQMKQMGIDRATARRVLKIWRAAGATSPDALRKLFVKRSLGKSVTLAVQLALDVGASAGAFYTGVAISQSQSFGAYSLAVEYLAYFLGMYLALSAALDLFGLGALAVATVRYSTNADAFLLAVQELAGQDSSSLDVVNKARKAVSMVKVLQALQSILDMLQGQQASEKEQFFRNLAAYLTMERAERVYKFNAEDFNLTDAQAADIAGIFAQYDANDDGVIDIAEFRRLCAKAAPQLQSEEVEAALEVLDLDKSGSIDFGEFVAFWVRKVQQPELKQEQAQEPQQQAAQP